MSLAHVPNQYMTVAEVAKILRVSKMNVYRLVKARALASVRFGRSYRIPETAVEDYIRQADTPQS